MNTDKRQTDLDQLTEEVRRTAVAAGASLVGFADLEGLAELPRGIAVAVGYSPSVFGDVEDMPNAAFAAEYLRLDALLGEIAQQVAGLAEGAGCNAIANPATGRDPVTPVAPFQHKTAATRAGLGWIGKSALLVTPELGPAVRLNTVLTDAPLRVGEPVADSRCGDCKVCVDACPARAIKGEHWYAGRPREDFYDAHACRQMCRARASARGVENGGCGVCMAVCPRRPKPSAHERR